MKIITDESMEEYHANDAVGSSVLSDFIKSPQLFFQKKVLQTIPNEETPAMKLGTAYHALVQNSFDEEYEIGPQVNKNTKIWKEAVANTDKILLTPSEHNLLLRMYDGLQDNSIAVGLLDGAEYETVFRMKYKNFEIQCRADGLHRWSHALDIKTTQSLDSFEHSVEKYNYARQAVFYQYIISKACGKTLPFTFIVSEKEAPFRTKTYSLSPEYLHHAWKEVETALDEIADRIERNDWQEKEQHKLIEIPKWKERKIG